MTQRAGNYAAALYVLTDDREMADRMRTLFSEAPLLANVLEDPRVPLVRKEQIIAGVAKKAELSTTWENFLKYLCAHKEMGLLADIVKEYDALWEEKHHILRAELLYAKAPTESERKEAEEFLQREYPGREIRTTLCIREELLGGLCIRVGHTEYDWSYAGRLRELERKLTVR